MTDSIALFPLPVVLFPGSVLPLHIFEPRYREMVGECLTEGKPFGVLPSEGDLIHPVGCTAWVTNVLRRYPDGRMDVLTVGQDRFRVESYDNSNKSSLLRGKVEYFEDEPSTDPDGLQGLTEEVFDAYQRLTNIALSDEQKEWNPKPEVGRAAFFMASALCLPLEFRQKLLEARCEEARLMMLQELILEALGEEPSSRRSQQGLKYLTRWFARN